MERTMPIQHFAICRPNASQDEHFIGLTRETVRKSIDLLEQHPKPDTFLGRKTQEPYPMQEP